MARATPINKAGRVAEYGFGCGYIERRDRSGLVLEGAHFDGEAYVVLSRRGEGYHVTASGRYLRAQVYGGRSLTEARKVFDSYPLAAEHRKAKAEFLAANTLGGWHALGHGWDVLFGHDGDNQKTMTLRNPRGERQHLDAAEFERLAYLVKLVCPTVEEE